MPVFSRQKDDTAKYTFCQTRYFEIDHEIFVNDAYKQDEKYKLNSIEELRKAKAKGLQPTTNVQDALDESGIAYDKSKINTSTYFWQEL